MLLFIDPPQHGKKPYLRLTLKKSISVCPHLRLCRVLGARGPIIRRGGGGRGGAVYGRGAAHVPPGRRQHDVAHAGAGGGAGSGGGRRRRILELDTLAIAGVEFDPDRDGESELESPTRILQLQADTLMAVGPRNGVSAAHAHSVICFWKFISLKAFRQLYSIMRSMRMRRYVRTQFLHVRFVCRATVLSL